MATQVFLNDISLPDGVIGYSEAKKTFLAFVHLLKEVRRRDRAFVLYLPVMVSDLQIGPCSVAKLRNDADCSDESLWLKTLADRAPYAASLAELSGPDSRAYEFIYHDCQDGTIRDRRVEGLGLAYLFDSLAVAFNHDHRWRVEWVEVERRELTDAGEIIAGPVRVRHAGLPAHLATHAALFAPEPSLPQDGRALWRDRAELFPHLAFIGRVRPQLEAFEHGDERLRQVWKRFGKLDRAVGTWDPAVSKQPVYGIEVKEESESRIDAGLVDFQDDEGITRPFSLHFSVTPDPHRVHFRLETAPTARAVIGHVGRKLGIG